MKSLNRIYLLLIALVFISACGQVAKQKKFRIGFLMETLKEERWQHDRDFFVAKAESLGAEVLVQACNGNDEVQIAQAENMITQGVDLLVVISHNGQIAATIVKNAHKHGVRVIGYDRIIKDCDLDLYISFDNEKVGELQAKYLTEKAPEGNYVLIGGAPTDNNALLFRKGQMNILDPFIKAGKINIIADQWATDWQPIEAMKHMENVLIKNKDITAVVASNDGTAGGAIQALHEQKLDGVVLVSGQDADLAGCQRIVAGTQSMTIYKPIKPLAETAAEAAMQILNNEVVVKATRIVNNGLLDIPSILLTPITVDKSNMLTTVIADGYQKKNEVYK